jgi:diketogulonate reductase-like aldo/keto reductase
MGTWHLGESPATRAEEIATLRLGIDLGMNLVDTAEMYGEGLAEELVGEALVKRRDEFFLVTKVYPHNASRLGLPIACAHSLRRPRTEKIDLYLLHWRGNVPLKETVAGFIALQDAGVIRYWGVSNFDAGDMEELWSVHGGSDAVTDQGLYNLMRRGIEWNLYHWLRQHRLPVMAYSPFDQARLLHDQRLIGFARANDMTPAQVALAWLISHDDVIAIPRTGSRHRLQENARAMGSSASCWQAGFDYRPRGTDRALTAVKASLT